MALNEIPFFVIPRNFFWEVYIRVTSVAAVTHAFHLEMTLCIQDIGEGEQR